MGVTRGGAFRLFRVAGIDVYLHWSWLLVALFQVQYREALAQQGESWMLPLYDRRGWYWIEYLALFAIVLLHEFGHAFACRQVGGIADHIVLWPLGGIAFSRPPARPGALLWTIAAGPLVNFVLVPILGALWAASAWLHWSAVTPDLAAFLPAVFGINLMLLIFNLIPVYPLDGGQIFQALLWFVVGRADSLMIVSILGMVIGGMVLILALWGGSLWYSVLAAFVIFVALNGFRHGRILSRLLSMPRRADAACPSCGVAPIQGDLWVCDECGTRFDLFGQRGRCPVCAKLFATTRCPDCYQQHAVGEWFIAPLPHDDSPRYAPH
jgi:Zn-dependent protease